MQHQTLVGSIRNLDPAIRELLPQLADETGIELTVKELQEMMTLEREYRIWRMNFREDSPDRIEKIAPVYWAFIQAQLIEHLEYAVEARMWQAYINDLTLCDSLHTGDPNAVVYRILQVTPGVGTPLPPFEVTCTLPDDLNLEEELSFASEKLTASLQSASGLSPSLLIDFLVPPAEAVPAQIFDRGLLIFAGAAVGFLAGILGLWGWSSKIEKRNSDS